MQYKSQSRVEVIFQPQLDRYECRVATQLLCVGRDIIEKRSRRVSVADFLYRQWFSFVQRAEEERTGDVLLDIPGSFVVERGDCWFEQWSDWSGDLTTYNSDEWVLHLHIHVGRIEKFEGQQQQQQQQRDELKNEPRQLRLVSRLLRDWLESCCGNSELSEGLWTKTATRSLLLGHVRALKHPNKRKRSDSYDTLSDSATASHNGTPNRADAPQTTKAIATAVVVDLKGEGRDTGQPWVASEFGLRMTEHWQTVENQHYLRRWLDSEHCCAFVPNGSVLARAGSDTGGRRCARPELQPPSEMSAFSDARPLLGAVPFESPISLQRTVSLPYPWRYDSTAKNTADQADCTVSGLAVPVGVVAICGGGFHGKSTLLRALALGVYDKPPGDGREGVVVPLSALSLRAEDGRPVNQVDISPFISSLPEACGAQPDAFTTRAASGSTSQAAGVVEGLQVCPAPRPLPLLHTFIPLHLTLYSP